MHPVLRDVLRECRASDETQPVIAVQGHPVTQDAIDAQILCAAHDAGLEAATEVTSACLRHTYLAFLVRQGMRFADLMRLVGPLPADIAGAYSRLSPPGVRRSRPEIRLCHPALNEASV
jgi:site-specific recombinase XerD